MNDIDDGVFGTFLLVLAVNVLSSSTSPNDEIPW